MVSASRKIAREELIRIIELCENIEKSGIDPFSVDVKSLLVKLRRILESQRNLETVLLDAETLYKIALVIALQHKWLRDRAASLFVDAQLITMKILAADLKTLAGCLASCWRPIVYGEQLTKGMLRDGLGYFLNLPSRALKPILPGGEIGSEVDSLESLLRVFSMDSALEDEVRRLHSEMLEMVGEGGRLEYWSFIERDGLDFKAQRAYVVAFIVSEGLAEIHRNPLTGEIFIIPYSRKLVRSNIASLPISIGSDKNG